MLAMVIKIKNHQTNTYHRINLDLISDYILNPTGLIEFYITSEDSILITLESKEKAEETIEMIDSLLENPPSYFVDLEELEKYR